MDWLKVYNIFLNYWCVLGLRLNVRCNYSFLFYILLNFLFLYRLIIIMDISTLVWRYLKNYIKFYLNFFNLFLK